MRRKPGQLVPLERQVLDAALGLRGMGVVEAHGFLLARTMRDQVDARQLTAYGTLYKALDRLERAGLLESRWEDPAYAAEASRPRRRLYKVTALGERAYAAAGAADRAEAAPDRRPVPNETPVR